MKRLQFFRQILSAYLICAGMGSALADSHTEIPKPAGTPAVPEEFAAVTEELAVCFDCHAVNGFTPESTIPILSGQEFYYLYVQLKDFEAGRRASDVMGPMASQLTRDEMKLVAQYYAEQPWPEIGYRGVAKKVAAGRRAAAAGQCVQCHLGGYEGNSRVPRLAGQYPGYLRKTMIDFKTKARANSPAKSSLMDSFDKDELDAIAEFLAGL